MNVVRPTEKALSVSMKVVLDANFTQPTGLAMIIDSCPRFVQRFLASSCSQLSRPQRVHLWRLVLAIATTSGAAKLSRLAAMVKDGRHRTRLGGFLRDSDWDASAMLAERAMATLRWMKPRRGETIELLIDDTRVVKRGKQMDCLQKIWDHKHKGYARGHIWVFAALRFRGVVLPWRIVLWKPKRDAGVAFRKITQIGADLVAELDLPWALKVRVLFDAYYLCPPVTEACKNKGFDWLSVASRNRTFHRDGGKKAKIGRLAPGWLKHMARTVRMPRARGSITQRIASVDGALSRIGRVRLVAAKRPRDAWGNMVVFVTNRKWDARKIVSLYERRWDIEVMFKHLRTDLGLGDYQMLDEQGFVRHLHLCALAHLLLTHHAMEGVGAQARKATEKVALPAMSIRQETLRTAIRRDQVKRLVGGSDHRKLRMKLEPYLMAA